MVSKIQPAETAHISFIEDLHRMTPQRVGKRPLLVCTLDLAQVFHLLVAQEATDVLEVLANALVTEFKYFRGQAIQEITVVGYENERSVERFKRFFQNIFRLDIQVV